MEDCSGVFLLFTDLAALFYLTALMALFGLIGGLVKEVLLPCRTLELSDLKMKLPLLFLLSMDVKLSEATDGVAGLMPERGVSAPRSESSLITEPGSPSCVGINLKEASFLTWFFGVKNSKAS